MSTQASTSPQHFLGMPGFEADNLLAFLAHIGLLRALETRRPEWSPRSSWHGPPWEARLHLAGTAMQGEVAEAAADGVAQIAARFDVDGRKNVSFTRDEFRTYAIRVRSDSTGAALAAALAAEWPLKREGALAAGPLVMQFGQGWQNFLDRLVAIARGDAPSRMRKLKRPPNLRDPRKIEEAIFAPWTRTDETDAFRWDSEEDQRYALRFDDPSLAGAAATVHGANRLASVGFLSFPSMPRSRRMVTPGVVREPREVSFLWPIWTVPLSRIGIENLLAHPDLAACRLDRLRPLGVAGIFRARRVSNGKFMNVSRGTEVVGSGLDR